MANLLNDDAGTMDPDQASPQRQDTDERPASLPWLFPWVLAFTGILITLALTR
jgi:hypothetical protein